jgi:hypothetical protein
MINYIKPLRKIIGRIKSLYTKGQMYGIENYDKAKMSISVIEHVYGQMETFTYFVGNTSLNWEHPEVQKTLSGIAEMDVNLIETNLAEQSVEYLKFAKHMYEKI